MSEKERLKAEVRRLKNLKREEIQAKMRQIASVGGLAGADAVAAANLDKEFDPGGDDEMMSAMYGDEYYDGAVLGEDGEALEKPEFGNLDEEVRELMGDATEEDGGAAEESATFPSSPRRQAAPAATTVASTTAATTSTTARTRTRMRVPTVPPTVPRRRRTPGTSSANARRNDGRRS